MIIFVNGYTVGCQPFRPYWSSSKNSNEFIDAACNYFQDSYNDDENFVNGSGKWFGSLASFRFAAGKKYALDKLETYKALLPPTEKLNIISHSMGAAFAEGMIDVFCQHQLPIGKIVYFAPAHARKIKISPTTNKLLRLQLNASEDTIIERLSDPFMRGKKLIIPGVNLYGKVHWNPWFYHPKHMIYVQKMKRKHQQHPHFDLKTYAFVFDWLRDLETLSQKNKTDQGSIKTKFEAVYMQGKYFELM